MQPDQWMMKPFIGLGIKNRASGMLQGVYASNNRTTPLNLHNGKLPFIWLANDLMLLLKLRYWKANSKSWKYCKSETFWEVFSNTVKLSLKANRQALPWKLLEVMVCIWLWLKSKNTKVVNSANTPSSMTFNLFRPRFKWCKLKNQY